MHACIHRRRVTTGATGNDDDGDDDSDRGDDDWPMIPTIGAITTGQPRFDWSTLATGAALALLRLRYTA